MNRKEKERIAMALLDKVHLRSGGRRSISYMNNNGDNVLHVRIESGEDKNLYPSRFKGCKIIVTDDHE